MKKKRRLITELTDGFAALADQRAGKHTLRTHVGQTKATPKMSAKELSALKCTRFSRLISYRRSDPLQRPCRFPIRKSASGICTGAHRRNPTKVVQYFR
jgi:hypothetical protein